jgi:SAM-dependent methyltransferase
MNGLGILKLVLERFPRFSRSHEQVIRFRCNICGRMTRASPSRLTRENVSCRCGSTVRLRALAHVLSMELFGKSIAIPDMPFRPDLIGVDMSAAANFAGRLAERIGYTNTFLHKPPFLDIVTPPDVWLSRCDFVISSDVFEHVGPPVSRAFKNTLRLLKPGGVLVLTVPYAPAGETVEHFPELHQYHIDKRDKQKVLVNRTAHGEVQEFNNLVFHGGDGDTLEMRVFSESGVLRDLECAGFTNIHIHREPFSQFGIAWPQEWSLPISARRPLEQPSQRERL